MKNRIPSFAFVALALLWSLALPASAATSRALQSIDFSLADGERVLLTLTLSEPAPEPHIFTVETPARLSLDLPDTRLAVVERLKRINIGAVRNVAAAESKGRTRVVVEMTTMLPHRVRTDGNKIYLELLGAGHGSGATIEAPRRGAQLQGVDFRRGEKGEGRVIVRLSDPQTPVDVREEGGRVIARFKNASVSDPLLKRLDVLDFATPVKYIDTVRSGINTEVVVTPTAGDFEQAAYQSGNVFTLELQPLTASQVEERRQTEPQYTGERISLSFQNVDVRSLLQIIADVAGTNMVVSDSVQGEIAMRLQNVPWDQALDIILRTKGLGMRQEGNVMLVAPLTELAEREKAELEAAQQKVDLAPLRSELIQVNYAKAAEMAALLAGETSILSERGRVSVDERTNSMLVLETREKLAEIRSLVARLDIPVRQVLIESRIVVASDDFARDLGTRFGVSTIGSIGDAQVGTSGSVEGARSTIGIGEDTGTNIPTLDDSLSVSLPAAVSSPGRFGLAILGSDYLVDLELSALQAEGRGEVISNPRVITANAKQALVEQGREIPYQQSTSSGATSVSFKKAVLSLTVTPQITPDARVIMDISVTNDTQGEDVNTGTGGSAPAIDTQRLTTQVLVNNGATVVLGGVFQQDNSSSSTKVPFLGDIPLFGALFRSNSSSSVKRELLIFVTPKILQEGLRVE